MAAKRSACSFSAAAKKALISSAGGVISWGPDVVAGDDWPLFFWPARSDSRSLTSPCARLDGVVSLLNFQKPRGERRQEHAGRHNSTGFGRNKDNSPTSLAPGRSPSCSPRPPCCDPRLPVEPQNRRKKNGIQQREALERDLEPFLNSNSRVSPLSPPRRRSGRQGSCPDTPRPQTTPCWSNATARPRAPHPGRRQQPPPAPEPSAPPKAAEAAP